PYLFYVKVKGVELIGSSPERLIQIENGHLEIHPNAGTRRRGRDAEEDARLYAAKISYVKLVKQLILMSIKSLKI
ncbi:chorismate-binding protein, partial [Priestia megaterium]|uniref:chorismate-binding protein n=1 Tax=Priestia megaterium TaxID=1404 RepID=UPI002FFDD960